MRRLCARAGARGGVGRLSTRVHPRLSKSEYDRLRRHGNRPQLQPPREKTSLFWGRFRLHAQQLVLRTAQQRQEQGGYGSRKSNSRPGNQQRELQDHIGEERSGKEPQETFTFHKRPLMEEIFDDKQLQEENGEQKQECDVRVQATPKRQHEPDCS